MSSFKTPSDLVPKKPNKPNHGINQCKIFCQKQIKNPQSFDMMIDDGSQIQQHPSIIADAPTVEAVNTTAALPTNTATVTIEKSVTAIYGSKSRIIGSKAWNVCMVTKTTKAQEK